MLPLTKHNKIESFINVLSLGNYMIKGNNGYAIGMYLEKIEDFLDYYKILEPPQITLGDNEQLRKNFLQLSDLKIRNPSLEQRKNSLLARIHSTGILGEDFFDSKIKAGEDTFYRSFVTKVSSGGITKEDSAFQKINMGKVN